MTRNQTLEQRGVHAIMAGTSWRAVEDSQVALWIRTRCLFAIDVDGQEFVPAYAFDNAGQPLPALSVVLSILAAKSPIQVAGWFESTSSILRGRRPRELVADEPAAVISAARSHAAGPLHG